MILITLNLIDVLNQLTIIHENDDIYLLSIDLPTLETMNLEHEEGKIIYDYAGWVGFKLEATVKGCKICMLFLSTNNRCLPQSSLTTSRSLSRLNHPSKELFNLVKKAENFFRKAKIHEKSVEYISTLMAEDTDVTLGHSLAHNLREMAIQKYFHLHIHIRAQYITEQLGLKKQFASKAAAARTTIL